MRAAASVVLWWRSAEARHPVAPWATAIALSLSAAFALGMSLGPTPLSPLAALRATLNDAHALHTALFDVRLPRVVIGMAVGAALATAGALLQALVRNPLADPGVLGVTAGAGFAALTAIVFFPAELALLPLFAFGGGVIELVLLLLFAWSRSGAAVPLRIVLSGVAFQALGIALISLLTFLYADRAPAFAAFLAGSLNGLGWKQAAIVWVPTVIGVGLALLAARQLDLLLFDDATAGGRGLPVRRARLYAALLAALLAAGAVSVAGLIAFVGLVVPNALRLLVGPAHRALLPLSAAGGAALVVLADAVARTAVAPLELPVGALLALLGGPYFLFLLWRKIP